MTVSDTKRRTVHSKPYSGPSEVSDIDGLSARIFSKGIDRPKVTYRWNGKPQWIGPDPYLTRPLKVA